MQLRVLLQRCHPSIHPTRPADGPRRRGPTCRQLCRLTLPAWLAFASAVEEALHGYPHSTPAKQARDNRKKPVGVWVCCVPSVIKGKAQKFAEAGDRFRAASSRVEAGFQLLMQAPVQVHIRCMSAMPFVPFVRRVVFQASCGLDSQMRHAQPTCWQLQASLPKTLHFYPSKQTRFETRHQQQTASANREPAEASSSSSFGRSAIIVSLSRRGLETHVCKPQRCFRSGMTEWHKRKKKVCIGQRTGLGQLKRLAHMNEFLRFSDSNFPTLSARLPCWQLPVGPSVGSSFLCLPFVPTDLVSWRMVSTEESLR